MKWKLLAATAAGQHRGERVSARSLLDALQVYIVERIGLDRLDDDRGHAVRGEADPAQLALGLVLLGHLHAAALAQRPLQLPASHTTANGS